MGCFDFITKSNSLKYDGILSTYGFKLPFLAPIGFFLAGKLPYSFDSGYDRSIRGKLVELFGHSDIQLFFEVHLAQRLSLTTASLFLFTILYLLGDAEYSLLIVGFMISAMIYYMVDKSLDKKLKDKKRELLVDLPEFLNTLTLLINAGLPFTRAVGKVVLDKGPCRPLYKEMSFVLAEINAGKPAAQAYKELALRCKVLEITRLVSAVLQNMNRGSSDLLDTLRTLSGEAWEKRKDIARKKGEEASAKLVFPMVMVFIAIAIIVLAPAVMTMSR